MSPADESWLCLLLVALFLVLLFLRVKFPNASKRSETLVLLGVTVVFFSVCGALCRYEPHPSEVLRDASASTATSAP
jgi:hypothetical protein